DGADAQPPVAQRRVAAGVGADVVALDEVEDAVERDAFAGVPRDDIALSGRGAADAIGGAAEADAAAVGQRRGTGAVGADPVGGDHAGRRVALQADAVRAVARDQVAVGGVGATDGAALAEDPDADPLRAADRRRAGAVGADLVAVDRGAGGVDV